MSFLNTPERIRPNSLDKKFQLNDHSQTLYDVPKKPSFKKEMNFKELLDTASNSLKYKRRKKKFKEVKQLPHFKSNTGTSYYIEKFEIGEVGCFLLPQYYLIKRNDHENIKDNTLVSVIPYVDISFAKSTLDYCKIIEKQRLKKASNKLGEDVFNCSMETMKNSIFSVKGILELKKLTFSNVQDILASMKYDQHTIGTTKDFLNFLLKMIDYQAIILILFQIKTYGIQNWIIQQL